MGSRGDREFIIAFDVATGKEVWATPHGRTFANDRGGGPRGTPTIDGDRIYALGGSGDLSALDARTGKIAWTQNVLSKFGSLTSAGYQRSPLLSAQFWSCPVTGRVDRGAEKAAGSRFGRSEYGPSIFRTSVRSVDTQVIFFTALGLALIFATANSWEYAAPRTTSPHATPWPGNRVESLNSHGPAAG